MPSSRARVWITLLALCLGACELRVRTTETVSSDLSQLDGEWTGLWAPGAGTDIGGPLTVRLQRFEGAPVVSLLIDNPCITPRVYDLVMQGLGIELRADGFVVFGAQLAVDRTLRGTWQCTAGTGTWTATRARALPAIPDLSGAWAGALTVAPNVSFVVDVRLEQSVQAGLLALAGEVRLPELLTAALPVTGFLQVHDSTFDLVLDATSASPVQFTVSGVGDLAAQRLDTGFVQFRGQGPLPVTQGLVNLVRTGP